MSESHIRAELLADIAYVNLRGNPEQTTFVEAAEAALGQRLPVDANAISDDEHRVFWLGPDEWLITTAASSKGELLVHLNDKLAAEHAGGPHRGCQR